MNFLNPWLAALAALAIPLVVAFLNRRKVIRRRVPSALLLRELQSDRPSRRRFAVPQHWLALLLCLLAMAAVVVAVTDPVVEGHGPSTTVLVVDTTASMAAIEPGESQTRLARGLARVDDVLAALSGRDTVAVVEAGAEARVLVRPTADREAVKAALTGLSARGASAEPGAAFRLANALCATTPEARILLLTDDTSAEPPPLACPLELLPVGRDAGNAAITEFTAREVDALGLVEVWLEVENASNVARTIQVDLLVDDQLAEVVAIPVEPGGRVGRLTRLTRGEGERIEARLRVEGGNALEQDDHAFAFIDRGERTRVLLVTDKPGGFTTNALRLHPRAALTVVAPADVEADSGPYDLMVLDGAALTAEQLPKARHVVAFGAAAGVGATLGAEVARPKVLWWDFEHPLFRYVDLDRVEIEAAQPLVVLDGDKVLVRSEPGGALVSLREQDGQRWVRFGFLPEHSDLVLRIAFANLVANFVDEARAERSQPGSLAVAVGRRVPGARQGWTLTSANGAVSRAATDPITTAGIYTLRDDGGREVGRVTSNGLSDHEASLAVRADIPPAATVAAPGSWADELWRVPVLLALALLGMEWLLPLARGRRRSLRRPISETAPAPSPARSPR